LVDKVLEKLATNQCDGNLAFLPANESMILHESEPLFERIIFIKFGRLAFCQIVVGLQGLHGRSYFTEGVEKLQDRKLTTPNREISPLKLQND